MPNQKISIIAFIYCLLKDDFEDTSHENIPSLFSRFLNKTTIYEIHKEFHRVKVYRVEFRVCVLNLAASQQVLKNNARGGNW